MNNKILIARTNIIRKFEHFHYVLSSYFLSIIKFNINHKNDSKDIYFNRLTNLVFKIVSYQNINRFSEKAYMDGNYNLANGLREISLKKRLNVKSDYVIHQLRQLFEYKDGSIKYVSLTGIENLGFIIFKDKSEKNKIIKIHDYKAIWNKEIFFYTRFLAANECLLEIVPNPIIHKINLRGKTLELIEFDYISLEDMDYSMLDYLINPYILLSSIEPKSIDLKVHNNIPIDLVNNNYLFKQYKRIKKILLDILKDSSFINLLELKKKINQMAYNLINLQPSDYCLNHGDFDLGGIGGYGNKFISSGKVLFLDWSDLKYVVKGLNYIMLMRRHKSASEILHEIENSVITSKLSKTVKSIIILNIIIDYSYLFKQTRDAKIVNDIIFLLSAI